MTNTPVKHLGFCDSNLVIYRCEVESCAWGIHVNGLLLIITAALVSLHHRQMNSAPENVVCRRISLHLVPVAGSQLESGELQERDLVHVSERLAQLGKGSVLLLGHGEVASAVLELPRVVVYAAILVALCVELVDDKLRPLEMIWLSAENEVVKLAPTRAVTMR